MTRIVVLTIAALMLFPSALVAESLSGAPSRHGPYPVPKSSGGCSTRPSTPECGIEMTCAGRPIQLGYSSGVCFRASCPGVWGVIHERIDQASFRPRRFSYRHYSFRGYWDLKDQGVIESGTGRQRALFLVLPEDLIEFRLLDPDPVAAIELRELGYVKKGPLDVLQRWLAYRVYMENLGGKGPGRHP